MAEGRNAAQLLRDVLSPFDRRVQYSLQRLLFERLHIFQKHAAIAAHMASDQSKLSRPPDIIERMEAAKIDNLYHLLHLSGERFEQVLDVLDHEDVVAYLLASAPGKDVVSEDEYLSHGHLKLPSPIRLGKQSGTLHDRPGTTHDLPTRLGDRFLCNQLNTRTGEENLSYYQRQQLTYGKGVKGENAVAGAWEEVFAGGSSGASADSIPPRKAGTFVPGSLQSNVFTGSASVVGSSSSSATAAPGRRAHSLAQLNRAPAGMVFGQ